MLTPSTPPRPAVPPVIVEDRRYAEQLAAMKAANPELHIRPGQAYRWAYGARVWGGDDS